MTASYSLDGRTLIGVRYGYKYLNDKTTNYNAPDLPYWLYRSPSIGVSGVPREYLGGAGYAEFPGIDGDNERCHHAAQPLHRWQPCIEHCRPAAYIQGRLCFKPSFQ